MSFVAKKIQNEIQTSNLTSEILDILNCSKNLFFSAKSVRFEYFKRNGVLLRGRSNSYNNIYNDQRLRTVLGVKIGHVTRKLNRLGYIERVNRNVWKKIKIIDQNDVMLYGLKERDDLNVACN